MNINQSRISNSNLAVCRCGSRREFLWNAGGGLGGLALASLLGTEGLLADAVKPNPEFNGVLHHKARARRVIQLFMNGGVSQMEGDFEVHSMVMPTEDAPQKKLYDLLKSKYGMNQPWGVLAAQGMSQGALAVRGIEAAVRKFGAAGLSGDRIRAAMLEAPLEGRDGMLPTVSFDRSAPFPTSGLTSNVATIKGGVYTVVARDLPVPTLKKW